MRLLLKKKLWLLLLVLSGTVTMSAEPWDGQTVASSYAGGDGTKESPFLISNASELAKLAQDVNTEKDFSLGRYFRLTADITFNEDVVQTDLTTLQGGKAFPETPVIGTYSSETEYTAFQGVFDGDGHTISGIYMTSEQGTNYIALFRVLEGAEVRNLGLRDMFSYAGAYLAGIAARAIDSRIINCYVADSHIFGWGSNSGCIVGQALGTTKVQNCYSTGKIDGKNDIGALVGRIGNGDVNAVVVENCYTTATITLRNRENRGGVTATNSEGSIVRNCYFTSASGTNAVWPAQDKGTTVGCQLMTEAEMQDEAFLALLNSNSQQIAAACRWQQGATTPIHDYAVTTPDVENQRDVSALATSPVPASGDTHAAVDGEGSVLSWTAARDGRTVSQYIYIGTDSLAIANATASSATAQLGSETSYQLTTPLSNMQQYYWRVDRVDADGFITAGDVWMFQPRHLAFPGAEGYGRFARGGRGGKVVYVTNLNSEGPGSLRWALTNGQGPRTVLFKVSGVIDMDFKTCWTDDFVTLAAQTAPGKGICIKHSDIGVGSDCVVRHLRARRGLGTPDDTGNAIGTVYSDHTILDHVSASWGTDETFSSRSSRNITFQRSMISEALGIAGHRNYPEGTNHGYAATIGGDIGSFHHNLLADCNGRNWSLGGGTNANGEYAGRLDIFNNVVYNWNSRTTDGGAHEVNFVNNYYKMGPDTQQSFLFIGQIEGNLKGTQSAYVSGNVRQNKDGSLTEDAKGVTYRMDIRDGRTSLDWEYFVSEPFWPSYATIESAREAYKSVLSDVGANQPMTDLTDGRMVTETLNGTYTYTGSKSGIRGEIDDEQDAGGFEDYPETAWPSDYDSDNDGLPNWWEELRGTNPRSRTLNYADTNRDTEGDGYTELERYLDFMAQPHLWLSPGQTVTVDVQALFAGYTRSPQYTAESSSAAALAAVQLTDGQLTLTAGSEPVLTELTLHVADADGHGYERRLCVAVTNNTAMGVKTLTTANRPVSTQLFSINGMAARPQSARHGIYLRRTVDSEGHTKVEKVVVR